jgi:RNA polymerase sigma-70 factor (ECF subfamily)
MVGHAGDSVDHYFEDEQLVAGARCGDADAWERLYRRVYPRLAAYLARRVGFEHRDDAVSETMTRAVAGLDRMSLGPAGFDGWLFGIARRVAADHYRQASRYQRQRQRTVAAATTMPVDTEDGSSRLLTADEHAELRAAFQQLSPAEQEILELRVVAGLSSEQVAVVLGKRPGAIRTAQSRAVAHLRELFDQDQLQDQLLEREP